MAKKSTRTRIVFPLGLLVFPALHKPDTKFNPNGDFKTDVALDPNDEAVKAIITKLETTRDEYRTKVLNETTDKKKRKQLEDYKVKPVFTEQLDDDGEPTGKILLRAKQTAKHITEAGKAYEFSVAVVDAKRQKIAKAVWSGSEAKVAVDAEGYCMHSSKEFGVCNKLVAVQVIKLVSGGVNAADIFDEVEGGYTEESSGDDSASPFNGETGDDAKTGASPDGDF